MAAAEATVAQRRAAGQPSSLYVGVSWATERCRWLASIWHEGRAQHLGLFAEEEAAARAFDDAARRLRGDEAHGGRTQGQSGSRTWKLLNFPTEAEAVADPNVEATVDGVGVSGEPPQKKYPKPKPRQMWTEEEHKSFCDAIQKHGRDWSRVTEIVGTKTIQQVRSHAQKHFKRIQREKTGEYIPPPARQVQQALKQDLVARQAVAGQQRRPIAAPRPLDPSALPPLYAVPDLHSALSPATSASVAGLAS